MWFTNTSTPGAPPATEFEWDFGDGITQTVGTMAPVSHVYAESGTFTVTLSACNVIGCDTFTAEVVVEPMEIFLPFLKKN